MTIPYYYYYYYYYYYTSWMIKGSVPGRGKKGSGAHPTSYSIGSRVKAAGS